MVSSYDFTWTVDSRGVEDKLIGKMEKMHFAMTPCVYLKDLKLWYYFYCSCRYFWFPEDEKKPALSPVISKDAGKYALIYKTDHS